MKEKEKENQILSVFESKVIEKQNKLEKYRTQLAELDKKKKEMENELDKIKKNKSSSEASKHKADCRKRQLEIEIERTLQELCLRQNQLSSVEKHILSRSETLSHQKQIESCEFCKFWRTHECHRNPPPWHPSDNNDWCAEFRRFDVP